MMKLTPIEREMIATVRRRITFGYCFYTNYPAANSTAPVSPVLWCDLKLLLDKFFTGAVLSSSDFHRLKEIRERVEQGTNWYADFGSNGAVWLDAKWLLDTLEKYASEDEAPSTSTAAAREQEDPPPIEYSSEQKTIISMLRGAANRGDVGDNDGVWFIKKRAAAVLLEVIEQLQRRVHLAPPEPLPVPPAKLRIVFYDYYDKVMYADGKKVAHRFNSDGLDCWSGASVLTSLGYKVEVRSVRWEDMPPDPQTNERGHYAPDSLAELEDHFKNLETTRRRARIAALEQELADLRKEEPS